jgi:peroxiredoxin
MAPNLLEAGGAILMTWLEPAPAPAAGGGKAESHALRLARLREGSWSEPVTIVEGPGFFANWADFPSVARAGDGSLVAHWLAKSGAGAYAYDVRLARSTDGGATWSRLGRLNDDATESEHGFVSLLPEGAGLRAFWLDGRRTAAAAGAAGGGHGAGEHGGGPMTLRTAHVEGDVVGPSVEIDGRVCDCCQTGAAATSEGPVVVYRDRSEAEIRDMSIVRRLGAGWSAPAPVHVDGWEVPGCPVNGPAVAASGRRVVVAWQTVPSGRARVLAAFSEDAGASFAAPIEVDGDGPLGRVGVLLDGGGEALVSWLDMEGEEAAVRLRRVQASGAVGPVVTVGSAARARATGFPRIALGGEALLVAWVESGEPSRIRAAALAVEAVPRAAPAGVETGGAASRGRPWDGEPGSRAPEYAAASLDGGVVRLADLKGRPVLLNFWATWCAPCREEIPDLAALDGRHRGAGLRVVGVSLDAADAAEEVRRFAAARQIPYTLLRDPDDRAGAVFGLAALPATFLFDREGVLVFRRLGPLRGEDPELASALAKALGGSG